MPESFRIKSLAWLEWNTYIHGQFFSAIFRKFITLIRDSGGIVFETTQDIILLLASYNFA